MMHQGAQEVSNAGLMLSYGFFFLALFLCRLQRVRLVKDLAVSTFRMSLQLVLVAFILTFLFSVQAWYLTMATYLIMILFGAQTIYARLKIRLPGIFSIYFLSLFLSATPIMLVFIFGVIRLSPWYSPRYFIPLVGMIIGNSMNGTALAFERFFDEVRKNRKNIETLVSLGATATEAAESSLRTAQHAALLPTVSSMTGMGLVWLPGMMTGQILSGSPPLLAIKYQIAIMLAILGSVSLSSFLVLSLERRKLFDRHHLPIAIDEAD